jgi:hypothetical protein
MTWAFSGFIQARMLPSRTTPDLLGGMWTLLQDARRSRRGCCGTTSPHRQVQTDRAGGRVRRAPGGGGQAASAAGSGVQGFGRADEQVLPAALHAGPGFPFNSGCQRSAGGLASEGKPWYSRSRHGRPDELIVLDRERMRELPPVSPEAVFRNAERLPRDYYVRVFSND